MNPDSDYMKEQKYSLFYLFIIFIKYTNSNTCKQILQGILQFPKFNKNLCEIYDML